MNESRSWGLQWSLSALYLLVAVVSVGMVPVGYYFGTVLGLGVTWAWVLGLAAGLAAGLAVSVLGFQVARSVKLRLWEAGDLADQIARGDFAQRPEAASTADEIGRLMHQLNGMAGHLETAVGNLRQLAEQNRRLAEEARRGAAVEERARLARDLHDTVNQQLFVLAMRAAAARRRLEKSGEAACLVPELAALEELAREAHGEARQLILQLRPTTLEQQGIGPALGEYVQATAAREGWKLVSAIDLDCRARGREAEELFRVAQEALNNISKHAQAQTIWVQLTGSDTGIRLEIQDDGQGFDPRSGIRPTAVGLVGMRERMASLGGTVRIQSAPGQGTTVTVVLPLPSRGGEDHDSSTADR